jgi:8-hydroxy-5-deazaflavin:NADPH oxidoreductase
MGETSKAKPKVGIIGSGDVGQALATGFARCGYEVKVGSRTPDSEKLRAWAAASGTGSSTGTFAEAAAFGEVLVLSTLGSAAEEAIDLAGPSNFGGKLLIDTTNPLDYSKGMPPGLFFGVTDSLGERVQRKLPSAKVVKCFNTVPYGQMFKPTIKDVEMLICGNDKPAKDWVADLLLEFGWKGVLDIGGIDGARWLEALVPLWVRTRIALKSRDVIFKALRP